MTTPPDPINTRGIAGIVNRDVIARTKAEQDGDPLDDLRQAPLSFRIIRRLLSYARPYRRKMAVMIACVIARGIQLPLLAWAVGAIINGPIARGDEAALRGAVAAFFAFACLTEFIFHFRVKLAQEIGEAVVHDLRLAMFQRWLGLTLSYFQKVPVGRMISRLTGDAEGIRMGVQSVLFVTIVQCIQMTICGLLMAYTDAILFLCALGIAPVVWGLNLIFHKQLSAAYRAQSDSFSRISATMAESVGGVRVTQSFGRQEVNETLFHELVADHARFNFQSARAGGIFLPLLELGSQVFIAALVLIGGWRVLQPDIAMPIGTMIQFFFLAALFFQPLIYLGNMLNEALTAMAGAEKIFHILDTTPTWQDSPNALRPERLQGSVEFRNVEFSYDTDLPKPSETDTQPVSRRQALRGISFKIEPGTCVALVGATGSGKTTLASLIAKFHLPTAGSVLLDGHDTRELHSDAIHQSLGVVPQQNFLFLGSVLDNIRVVRPAATRDEVIEALRKLNCLDVIDAIQHGLDAQVGEHGSGLSLGQRQIICFARALLADPALLILDEATSAVDPITERKTQAALFELLRGRTSFIVAHRLSTIRSADIVLVLDQGRIIEQGSPDALLKSGGAFAALWAKMA